MSNSESQSKEKMLEALVGFVGDKTYKGYLLWLVTPSNYGTQELLKTRSTAHLVTREKCLWWLPETFQMKLGTYKHDYFVFKGYQYCGMYVF